MEQTTTSARPTDRQIRTLVSIAHDIGEPVADALASAGDGLHVTVRRRRADWGLDWHLTGMRSRLHHLRNAVGTVWACLHFDALVLMDVGALETVFVGALLRLLLIKVTLVVVNYIPPGPLHPRRLSAWALARVERWGVVRRGDTDIFAREQGIDPSRCRFIAYPANPPEPVDTISTAELADLVGDPTILDQDYVYAAGYAYRDWDMLLAALSRLDCRAVLSIAPEQRPPSVAVLPARITVLDRVRADAGRALARHAAVVAVPLRSTTLPAGPVVLLDAMALGRAVVATDTNGTRDYVRDGETGVLVPPGDPDAMADAVAALLADPPRRDRLGRAARAAVAEEFTPAHYARDVAALLVEARAGRSSR